MTSRGMVSCEMLAFAGKRGSCHVRVRIFFIECLEDLREKGGRWKRRGGRQEDGMSKRIMCEVKVRDFLQN